MSEAQTGGIPQPVNRLRRLRVDQLVLDPENPRLPTHVQASEANWLTLLLYIDKRYNPIEIAQSIARHGFFESEPLIAVKEAGTFVVVEGNRRLSALLGLTNYEAREALGRQTRAWRNLPMMAPPLLPVLVVQSRESVAPLLGYRHITGIEAWEPFAQARYIASLVDKGNSLPQVAELVGRKLQDVRAMYRDHEIVIQAKTQFSLVTDRVENDFGVFTSALSIKNIRQYIDAPTPAGYDPTKWPLGDDMQRALTNLLTFLFGNEEHPPALPESRFLKDLGTVLSDPTGRGEGALLAGSTLEEALEAVLDPGRRFSRRLTSALAAIERAIGEMPPHVDVEQRSVASAIVRAAQRLEDGVSGQ